MTSQEVPLIVGAGPVGLGAALFLTGPILVPPLEGEGEFLKVTAVMDRAGMGTACLVLPAQFDAFQEASQQ